jgi:hypothetical protein
MRQLVEAEVVRERYIRELQAEFNERRCVAGDPIARPPRRRRLPTLLPCLNTELG